MPQITGRTTARDDAGSVTASLRDIGESMFKPIDPVSQERIRQMQMQGAARAKMIDALQRGDLIEYGAQGLMAGVPINDAQGYAMQAGAIGPDGRPLVPRFSPAPQPPAPMATGSNAAAPQSAPQPVGISPWS